jgi:hypothetical protein
MAAVQDGQRATIPERQCHHSVPKSANSSSRRR